MKKNQKLSYITLFSGAGIGCFGFKQEDFSCIATNELLEKRLKFQKYNSVCEHESGYISGDLRDSATKQRIFEEFDSFKRKFGVNELDVLLATPPCQGMSVANHKKKNEKGRNSLVIESIRLTNEFSPKFFIFENVRAFLNTICTDIDGKDKKIKEAIEVNLSGKYHIAYKVINFKDFGSPSSRTRTLVIGTRKDLLEITPFDIFPNAYEEKKLKEVIGDLPKLSVMGEISPVDIYHQFRSYNPDMLEWVADLKEGQSAFENTDNEKIPHKKINGKIVHNVNKNSDKYRRCFWDKVAPCIHTRNDIFASQNTIHPRDNRVFSIRELMRMMSIPDEFRWADAPIEKLNSLPEEEKKKFLSKEEMTIRHSIGEGVPTAIFRQIASKINSLLTKRVLSDNEVREVIRDNDLGDIKKLKAFLKKNVSKLNYPSLSKIAELANSERLNNAAYYTRQDICYTIIKDLPEAEKYRELRILEPAIGVGNFIPLLIEKYRQVPKVYLDVVDIDANSLDMLRLLLASMDVPSNFKINFINDDFLLHHFSRRYDIVIGNPPYKKLTDNKELLEKYRMPVANKDTNNLFSFFIEKSLELGNFVSLIVPKSLLNAPEFNKTRGLMSGFRFKKIIDYNEKGFKGVKIETMSFIIDTSKKTDLADNPVEVESYITNATAIKKQGYIFPKNYPYWVIYRDEFFDKTASKLEFNIFKVFRDRQITKKITRSSGKIRVLKSRNIGSNEIKNLKGYDCYIQSVDGLAVSKYMNNEKVVLVPNLTYNPRACFLPKNTVTDGSVAILFPNGNARKVWKKDLEYYNSEEFGKFYMIARNHGTRSLNIDSNSVFFFGVLKK